VKEDPQKLSEPELRTMRQFRRMRRFATGLLIAMAVLLLLSRWGQTRFDLAFLEYFHAFAEAAVVGALADWFAVTALFRHPLGIPIPHTAIIPQNKDSIGRGLGNFVERNFLAPEVLSEKIERLDVVSKAEDWVAEPENSRMIAQRITQFLPELLDGLDDEDVRIFLSNNLSAGLEHVNLANIAGNGLEIMLENDEDQEFFNELVEMLRKLLDENKTELRKALRNESPWLFKGIMENQIFDRVIMRLNKGFNEIANDPQHPVRKRFLVEVRDLAERLKTSEEMRERSEELKRDIMSNEKFQAFITNIWEDVKQMIREDAAREDSRIQQNIHRAIYSLFNNLLHDQAVRDKLNSYINEGATNILARNRNMIATMIENTIRSWDKETMVDKLEMQVGKDLQFIRINGTLVGGTVGLLLHVIADLF
jgi:uncharacterized membrane-anchored protein YjiN (DUF445 family)